MITNATVTLTHLDAAPGSWLRAHVRFPSPELFEASGGSIFGKVKFAPGTDVRPGDVLTLVALDGHRTLDAVTRYTLAAPVLVGGLLSYIRCEISGVYL